MKYSFRVFSILLALLLLFSALPLTAHAQSEYPQAEKVGFRIRQDGSFVAVWTLDYSGLDDDVSVFHTLEFYRINQYTHQKMFELEQEGRVNEIDLTPYKEWYFGSTEWSYYVQLITQYSVVENGTTYTTTMNAVKSSSGLLFDLQMPDPVLTGVVPAVYHEGDPVVAFDLSWEHLQDDCKLQFTLTVNDSEVKRFDIYPDDEKMPVNATQCFYMSVSELNDPFKEGDCIHCEIQVYRMVTATAGTPVGESIEADIVVQSADPNVPKITDASYPILRAGARTVRLSVTWENMPLEDCALELVLTVNDGQEQRFEVTPSGDNAVRDGTRSFEISTGYLKKTLRAGDRIHTELTFIRDSDGIPLSMPYAFDAVVKAATETKFELSQKIIAIYSATGECAEIVLSDEEKQLPSEEQSAVIDSKVREWFTSKGADADSIGNGNVAVDFAVYGDGVALDQTGMDFMVSEDQYLYDVVTYVYGSTMFLLTREPAMWGDVDRNGDVNSLDVTWIQRKEAKMDESKSAKDMLIPYTLEDYDTGDVDQSGETDIIDASLIQHWLAKCRSAYPIGEPIPNSD